jgi:TRAP-type C4-dicarboxylate transport system substrate-binding protein
MPHFSWHLFAVLSAAVVYATAAFSSDDTVRIDVVVQDEKHHAWTIAEQLQELAATADINITAVIAPREGGKLVADFMLLPLRSMALQVPELHVLELPFFYTDIAGVHRALEGPLAGTLQQAARTRGWEIVAFLDEGMHVMSGPRRYDRAGNFLGMEFILTRPDPMADQLLARLRANRRHIAPQDSEEVMRECAIASRATTLSQMQREKLYLVHQNLALTYHRYEGWLVVAPVTRWADIDAQRQVTWKRVFDELTRWQREQSVHRESTLLVGWRKDGLLLHEVDGEERATFQRMLSAPNDLRPAELDEATWTELVRLASARAATITGTAGAAAPGDISDGPAPAPQHR